MGLHGRFNKWVDSHRKPQGNQEESNTSSKDGLRLTITIGGRIVGFTIGRSGKNGEASHESGGAQRMPESDDRTRSDGPPPPQKSGAEQTFLSAPYYGGPGEEQIPPPDQQVSTRSFWDALDPTEREALRPVASWRTFAAGARLMEEGDQADYVMVILGGRVKICVDDHGRERVVAVRGLGQLVGERGALQVSVRSAAVIALDMIWALVIQTKDFAAFVTAHPRVLDIVQGQLYERGTEPTWAGNGSDLGRLQPGTVSGPASGQPDHDAAGQRQRSRQPLTGENCTVVLTDVVGFGARTRNDNDRLLIREVLFRVTQAAVQDIPDARTEDRGDGFLTVIPPGVSTAKVVERLLKEFLAALGKHNSTERESVRFKLRLALNVGPVVSDMGVSGEAIIVAARLVDAPHFKEAIARSTAILGVIASPFVYETTIRHSADSRDLTGYSEVQVEVKESKTTAWMKLFDSPFGPQTAAPNSPLGLLTRAGVPSGPGSP
jgi:hypothetical protein